MYTWKNVDYADGSGLVDSIRKSNAQMAENDQAVVDAISGFGDDYSKLQTDSAVASIMSAATPEEAKEAYNQLAANQSGFIDKGTLGQTLKDQNKTFRDIATHEDNLATNALNRKVNEQEFDINAENREIDLAIKQQQNANDKQAYDQNALMDPERFKKLQAENKQQKFEYENLLKVKTDENDVSDGMAWLLDNNLFLSTDGANHIKDFRQEMLANNVDPSLYRDQLAAMSIKNLVNSTKVLDNLDNASETDIVSAINKINRDVITRFPGLSLDDAAKATAEMLTQSGIKHKQGEFDAAKVIQAFKDKEQIKFDNEKKLQDAKYKREKEIAWVKANSSGKASQGKTKLLDRLSKSEFAINNFFGIGDSPGTALMNKLAPMIETLYPNAKDQNKIWNYFATSGFPTEDSDMRNSYLIGGMDTASDEFNIKLDATGKPILEGNFLKNFIDKTGILIPKKSTDK